MPRSRRLSASILLLGLVVSAALSVQASEPEIFADGSDLIRQPEVLALDSQASADEDLPWEIIFGSSRISVKR